jgi:hypothetical protein
MGEKMIKMVGVVVEVATIKRDSKFKVQFEVKIDIIVTIIGKMTTLAMTSW